MKNKPNSTVTLKQDLPQTGQSLRERFGALLPLLFLSAGVSLWLCVTFPSLPLTWYTLFILIFTLGALLVPVCGTRAEPFVYAGVSAAACLSFAIRYKTFFVLVNDFFSALQHTSGHIYLHFDTSGSMAPVVVTLVCLSALLLSRAAVGGTLVWLLPIAVLMVEGAVSAVVPFRVGLALFVVGIVLLFGRQGLRLRAMLGRAAVLAVCVLLSLCIAVPLRDMPDNRLYPAIRQALHGVVYDKRTNAMPEGKLTKADTFDKNDTPALRVTLDTPQQLYLRGHIYETYTGSAWKPLPADVRDGYAELFYWLHDEGYFGQTQVGYALREVGVASQKITVENISACRAHGYLPYGAWGVAADETLIGDAVLPICDTFTLFRDDAKAMQRVQSALSGSEREHGSYLQLEQAFAEYVQKVDLTVPEDTLEVLDRTFGGRIERNASLSEVRTAIRDFLDETLTYDEQAGKTDRHTDFLQSLLENTRCGYSVHYATAATLLLRYCGVPARYVEGYYLPEGESGEVTLTEANAHAWAELYLDGVGFVPFEVTPGYSGADQPQQDSDHTTRRMPPSPGVMEFNTPPEETERPQEVYEEPAAPALWWIWILCPAVLLTAFLIWIVLRRRRLRRALRQIDSLPPREAVLRMYGYVLYLRRHMPDVPPDPAEITEIVQLSQFSDHAITDAQKESVELFIADVCRTCLSRRNVLQRFYVRYILCILI